MQSNHIHIGTIIQSTLQEKGISASWLAKKIHCHHANIYKIFQKENIDTKLLLAISIVLDTDLFSHYSDFINEKRAQNNCQKR